MKASVPAEMTVVPVRVLLPRSVRVPVPCLVSEPLPERVGCQFTWKAPVLMVPPPELIEVVPPFGAVAVKLAVARSVPPLKVNEEPVLARVRLPRERFPPPRV